MKKLNFLSKSFIVIIFIVFIWTFVKQGLISFHIIKFDKGDNWQVVEKSNDPIYDKIMGLEKAVENRVTNYFPFYNQLNGLYYQGIMDIDSLYLNDIYLKDNNDLEHLFYNKNDKFYFVVNRFSKEELLKRIDDSVKFFNNLSDKYKDVNFVIYTPLRYENASFVNIDKNKDLVNRFKNNLKNNIKYDFLDTENIEEYLGYYYRSDHHYNSYGAERAYYSILNMFKKDDRLEFNHRDVKSNYYGSAAKSLLNTSVSDTLDTLDYDISLENNIDDENFKPLTIPERSNIFYDYYVGYFNGQYDEIVYHNYNDKYKDNLLIISDSFAWQNDYLIAESFKDTYVVNLRYGKWKDNNLYLEDYIKNKNVKNVLFLQGSYSILYDTDNLQMIKKVI